MITPRVTICNAQLAYARGQREAELYKIHRRVRESDLKDRLHAIVSDIVNASDHFAQSATSGTITSISPAVSVGVVTGVELRAVYRDRFAKLRSSGRLYYDQIITSAPNGRCTLCAHRDVATLDHFLPQTFYPVLVVTPLNLVPACSDCNKTKLDTIPACDESVTLHPYFDNIEADEWLVAEIQETSPASVHFRVQPPTHWSSVLAARVMNHFDFFGLAELYSAQAAEELLNIRFYLRKLFGTSGVVGVTAHLTEMSASRARAHVNSWQTAAYKAFAASSWFCEGGFT